MKTLSPLHAPRARSALACLLAGAALLADVGRADAVTVTPAALFIDHRTRSASLTLHNPGLTAEEIEITFAFGYARSDEHGRIQVVFLDSVPPYEPSAVPFLRAFPRRLRLEPGQRQLVRILVQPPRDLADGEYWARVMVASTGGQPPIEQRTGDVRLQLEVRTVFAVALNYRHGSVATGLEVEDARVEATDSTLDLLLDMERQGNAAFLGHVVVELLDDRGRVVAEVEQDVAVYRRILWRFPLALPEGRPPAAGWRVRWRVDAERDGEEAPHILRASARSGTFPLP
ncbi:MAG TPA: hypothetical protein VMK65_03605 [Longimicrobiales bacterium]|nr:hypothetical protein [Longimicrobiales bacterium]